jgi:hypothetical protein
VCSWIVVIPKYVNRFGERTHKFLLPKIWNQIPVNLRSLQGKNEIKKLIKKKLASHCVNKIIVKKKKKMYYYNN